MGANFRDRMDKADYEKDAELWTDIGDRHVRNGDGAAADAAYNSATENRIAADLSDLTDGGHR